MRLKHPDGQPVHVAYCTNVHPAEDLDGIVGQLDTYAVPVRRLLDADVLGLGPWLSADAAAALAADSTSRARLRRELSARGLEVVTLNGFPYQAFQAPVVKYAVYQPDWTTRQRLDYTLNLAEILADLMPDDAERGSVSTLPLAWRDPWNAERSNAARRNLDMLATGLSSLASRTGRAVRVAFEPEPGCVIETASQAARELTGVDTRFLGVCLDLAHLACAWEQPADALATLTDAGLPVVKVQVSAALGVDNPGGARDTLRQYVEPRFLHQTRALDGSAADDLGDALDAGMPGPWRVHYHVPLHAAPAPPLKTTHATLRAALRELLGGTHARCDHFEVETYTWGVLPADQRPDTPEQLAAGIAAELAFARDEFLDLGLYPTAATTKAS
jgi:sugar phosphate isomerase/epimerase